MKKRIYDNIVISLLASLNLLFSKKMMYVVDPLEGEAFEKLRKNEFKIYGCGAIISALSLKVVKARSTSLIYE